MGSLVLANIFIPNHIMLVGVETQWRLTSSETGNGIYECVITFPAE